ncbi:hypothetical protein NS376_01205 [Pseudomonas oryzihabitans]|nr:hypothetical protein NS376_01205 [Pseudomonas psychrotolerans]
MKRTFKSIECALDEELIRVERNKPKPETLQAVEPSAVKQAIRDILSLEPDKPVPATENELVLFNKLYCLMSSHNRKWLSETQIALPYADLIAPKGPREAELKSRLHENYGEDESAPPRRGIALRNYFLDLLSMCLAQEEFDKYPHLLTLFEDGQPESGLTPVKESGAWYVLTHFQQKFFLAEKSVRPVPPSGATLADLSKPDYINHVHEKIFARLPDKVASSPWRAAVAANEVTSDSLFSRLLLNVALNRFILEQWAYVRRVQAAAPIQQGLVAELEKVAPNGIVSLLQDLETEDGFDYAALTKSLLTEHLNGRNNPLTPNMLSRIDQQANAITESALLKEFSGDVEINRSFLRFPVITTAMAWLALTYSYLHSGLYPDDDPNVRSPVSKLISRRSTIIVNGQHMVSLRRLVSSLMSTQMWAYPSTDRLRLHIRQVGDVRAFFVSQLKGAFKQTSLAQWDSVMISEYSPEQVAQAFKVVGLPARPLV